MEKKMVSYFVCLAAFIVFLTVLIFRLVHFVNKLRGKKIKHRTLACGLGGLILFVVSLAIGLAWIFSYDKISSPISLLLLTLMLITNVGSVICGFFGIIRPNPTKAGKVFCILVFIFETIFVCYAVYAVNNFYTNVLPQKEVAQSNTVMLSQRIPV